MPASRVREGLRGVLLNVARNCLAGSGSGNRSPRLAGSCVRAARPARCRPCPVRPARHREPVPRPSGVGRFRTPGSAPVSSGIQICSSGFCHDPVAPCGAMMPMISNAMPRIRIGLVEQPDRIGFQQLGDVGPEDGVPLASGVISTRKHLPLGDLCSSGPRGSWPSLPVTLVLMFLLMCSDLLLRDDFGHHGLR